MTVTTPARCLNCKTVLSPGWTRCQICRTSLPSQTKSSNPSSAPRRLRPGDHIVYQLDDTRGEGKISSVTKHGSLFTYILTCGTTIPSRAVRAAAFTNPDDTITLAMTLRGDDTMIPTALPATVPKQPAMSPWYRHWKDIATMTTGILPDEPRFKLIASMVDRCNEAYTKGDEPTFLRLKGQLQNLINASNPKAARQAP